jgi:AcrR family transcriptional regulator
MTTIASLYEAFLRKAPRHSRARTIVEALLSAAMEQLSREGSEDRVAVQGVADREGVGIGSLDDYFGDRRNLLAAVAAKVTEDNRRAFQAIPRRPRPILEKRGFDASSISVSRGSPPISAGPARS